MSFPHDFVWGGAAASYQVEGAAFVDGRTASVWDMLTRQEGAIFEGHTGDVATDHYHRFREDVALWQQINLRAYRLSISWSRVLPEGVGRVNEQGLAFYDQLVDALLAAGIQPWITLFHWDYPVALFNRGGWLNPDSPDWFAEYTGVVVDALSDRVKHWFTQNEPQCYIGIGHREGRHAPGLKMGWGEILLMNHHSLLAHGKSVQTIRARSRQPARIGAAPVGVTFMPATDSPADIEAARLAMFSVPERNTWNNTLYSDPMLRGEYPADVLQTFAPFMPTIGANDMATIRQPLDFYGCNIYHGEYVRAGAEGRPEHVRMVQGHPTTLMNWPVRPASLYWGPRFLYERYGLPVVIAENGMGAHDWVSLDGAVHDPQRIDLTARYLMALRAAIADGVKVEGYFHWSIMDNFEWAEGYNKRFGLIYVDYRTQQRILKDSALWYRDVIASNGANLPPAGTPYDDLSKNW